MYKVKVIVKRRAAILDPQGKAAEQGAKLLGFNNISGTRINKIIEFFVNVEDKNLADKEVKEYCEKLLSNPNIEDFEYTLEEAK